RRRTNGESFMVAVEVSKIGSRSRRTRTGRIPAPARSGTAAEWNRRTRRRPGWRRSKTILIEIEIRRFFVQFELENSSRWTPWRQDKVAIAQERPGVFRQCQLARNERLDFPERGKRGRMLQPVGKTANVGLHCRMPETLEMEGLHFLH